MSKLEAFSYSRLTAYETCPRKFYKLSVAKTIKEPPNEHTDYGTQVHEAFRDFFKKGKALPLHLRQHAAFLNTIKKAPGEFIVEQQIAINPNYEATGWFDKDVYCRVISDLTILNAPNAAMFDWKTGKMYDDFTQLRLAGAVIFLLAPEIERITLSYVWLKERAVTRYEGPYGKFMAREEMPTLWADLSPRIQKYQNAHALQAWEPRSGTHCKWCPDVSCPFNQKRK